MPCLALLCHAAHAIRCNVMLCGATLRTWNERCGRAGCIISVGCDDALMHRNQTMGSCRGPVDKLRVPGAICQLEGVHSGARKKTFLSTGMCQQEGLTVSTGILQGQAGREHPVRCTGRNRSWVHGRARASTSILCGAAQVGIVHGSMGEHEHPRASRALHM